jgi:hypothetical protein
MRTGAEHLAHKASANGKRGGKAVALKKAQLRALGVKQSCSPRLRAWKPWIKRFNMNAKMVTLHSEVYTLGFAKQVARCKSDDARILLLQIPAK